MAWKGVITNVGAALLDQWALGGTLTITSAATGTGTVSESALIAQTSLVSGKQTASIISSEKLTAGIKLKLQITAPQTSYLLQQYGVWAKLGSGAATLLALFQNPDGITIPSSTEAPDFVYTLFALIKISNTGELEVTVDTSALASQHTLDEAIESVTAALTSHTGNTTVHITAAERTTWNNKVDKVSGKGLSTEDYTTAEKTKLAGIEAQANKYTHPSYTARTGKPAANLTPGFGGTVTVSQITSDASGHVTGATDRTITIPSAAASTSAAGLMSAADKTKLNGVATGAEVNQNAFSNVKVGSTTVAADAKTDTLELVAGSNVTLTPDATNDKVTIAATDTTYSSKAAASGGTAVSLVTTGEKYTWNSKANGSHTHGAGDITSGTLAAARLPAATASAQGAVKLGAAGGAAAYSHTHAMSDVSGLTSAIQYGPAGIVGFQGSEDFPLAGCVAEITPVQAGSGDPSPTNVRAISGWTGAKVTRAGKNLLNKNAFTGSTHASATITDTGVRCTSLREGQYVGISGLTVIDRLDAFIGKTLTLHCSVVTSSSALIGLQIRDAGNAEVFWTATDSSSASLSVTITQEYAGCYLRVLCYATGIQSAPTGSWSEYSNLQLEIGTTATAYEPYRGQTIDVTFPVTAGTVYGGTLDVLSGTLTVTHGYTTIRNLTWDYNNKTYRNFRASKPDDMINSNTVTACVCSCYPCYNNIDVPSSDIHLFNNGPDIAIKDLAFSNVEAFLAARGDEQIVYLLATPVTYQLTPQQVTAVAGSNHVWADCGNVTVEYGAFPGALQRELERHTHAATDITSGVLPVTRGGTGNATGYVTAGQKSGENLGSKATAEGENTIAFGRGAHAEGYKTFASGNYSHVEGYGTYAVGVYQHVFGRYNADSTSYVEIVGGGTGEDDRKNIRTLNWNGNEWIAGTLTQASDARLKDVHGEVPDVSEIRAVRFRWNDKKGIHDELDHIGYLAQDVEVIAPFLVGQDANGYKSLDYIALLTAKVEMLERQVMELKAERNKQ